MRKQAESQLVGITSAFYLALAFLTWLVFCPGILSDDSLVQFRQAMSGELTDGHPPFMAVVMRMIYLAGGDIRLITQLQCFAVLLGFGRFTRAVLGLVDPNGAPWKLELTALGVVLFVVATTPLLLFAVDLIKDVWLLAVFLWLGTLCVGMIPPGRRTDGKLFAASALMAAACLLRYNAILLLPLFGAINAVLATRRRWLFALLPAALWLVVSLGIRQAYDVKREHTLHSIMALDLLGITCNRPATLSEFPYIAGEIFNPDYRNYYHFANNNYLYYFLHVDEVVFSDGKALKADYLKAVMRHPWALAGVKLRAFQELVDVRKAKDRFPEGIWYAGYRYSQYPKLEDARRWIERRFDALHEVWLVRYVYLGQAVWLSTLAAILLWSLYARWPLPLVLLLSVPFVYAHTFLLATASDEYRYLLPAIVPTQAICLACAAWAAVRGAARLAHARAGAKGGRGAG